MERTHTFFKNKKPLITTKTTINNFSNYELAKAKSTGILPKNTIRIFKYSINF